MNIVNYFSYIPDCVGASDNGDGSYRLDFLDTTSRLATAEELLQAAKLQKIDELKVFCQSAIESGFVSNALGSEHTYDSRLPQDQTNLIGARLAGVGLNYTCTDSSGYKNEVAHTAEQIAQVYLAGMVHIQTNKARFYARKTALELAATIEEVQAVVW